MKITIYSANVGAIDHPQKVCKQTRFHKYNCFTYPIHGYDNRKSSKFYKTLALTHELQTDIAIWLDHRVDVISEEFVEMVVERLKSTHFIVAKHPERQTLAEEYQYIFDNIDKPYLYDRYANEPFADEMEAYKDSLDAELVNPRFFAADMRKKMVRKLMCDWWIEILRYTVFDQTQLTYLLHNADKRLKHQLITWEELNKYLQVNKHK